VSFLSRSCRPSRVRCPGRVGSSALAATSATLFLLAAGAAGSGGCSGSRPGPGLPVPPSTPEPVPPPPPGTVVPPGPVTPPPGDAGTSAPTPPPAPTWWKPTVGETWQWQLSGTIDLSPRVAVFDLDLFDTTAAQVTELHGRGAKVVCYMSAGSWEDWRSDKDQFPPEVLGLDYEDWPGERWIDIRQIERLAPVMRARLDLCKAKGFDAVEPDNMDAYDNETGFAITAADQIRFARWLAQEAHQRGLSIGLKNARDLAPTLQPEFDWALVEHCYSEGDWCAEMYVFVQSSKAVLMAEYVEDEVDWEEACARASSLRFSPILKNLDLDAWVERCPAP
jgi:endo-alpha-1,4-polygalactosaminidase (GH114 family)